ncbi:tetratricopeptide repeat protein [Paenibacillus humicola]|uniref:tetratricopeptide repeat protein n=1 Tax=Paenibacillus humicola TaxID=3110540 RepID=UPI00237B3A2D|nr:tetratricopeptide repeat protein [Paenibacillus humicola]
MDGESVVKKAYEAILSGDFELAIVRFEEAIALEPENAAFCYKCSITCARSGKWPKALHYAEEAVRLEPEQEEYRFHLQTVRAKQLIHEAETLLAQSMDEAAAAIVKLREASRLDPLSVEALLLLGAAYSAQGRLDEASQCAREAVRLEPGHTAARKLLSDIRRRKRLWGYGQTRKRKRNR